MTAPHLVSRAQFEAELAKGMSEAALQARVCAIARQLGWLVYHTHDSRRSEPGYPDLHLVHPKRGLSIFRELKREKGRLTAAQRRWLTALKDAGVDVGVWRPTDYVRGAITAYLAPPTKEQI